MQIPGQGIFSPKNFNRLTPNVRRYSRVLAATWLKSGRGGLLKDHPPDVIDKTPLQIRMRNFYDFNLNRTDFPPKDYDFFYRKLLLRLLGIDRKPKSIFCEKGASSRFV